MWHKLSHFASVNVSLSPGVWRRMLWRGKVAISLWTSPGKLLAPVFWFKATQAKGQAELGLHPEPLRQWAQRAVPGRSLLSGDQGMESWQGTLSTSQILQREILEDVSKTHVRLWTRNRKEPRIHRDNLFCVQPHCEPPTCTEETEAPWWGKWWRCPKSGMPI